MTIPAIKILRTWTKLLIGRSVWKSYSQSGEDAVVRALLSATKRGTYVDVGAFDPVLYSNTYYFYTAGWRGLVIDANASLAPLFKVIRPRDTFVNTAVGRKSELTYYRFADGAYNSLNAAQVAELAQSQGIRPMENYTVPVQPLTQIVRDAGLTKIDFLSVDVEGMDEEVLSSYDWRIRPQIVGVEDTHFIPENPNDSGVCRFMHSQGYKMAAFAGVSILFRDAVSA